MAAFIRPTLDPRWSAVVGPLRKMVAEAGQRLPAASTGKLRKHENDASNKTKHDAKNTDSAGLDAVQQRPLYEGLERGSEDDNLDCYTGERFRAADFSGSGEVYIRREQNCKTLVTTDSDGPRWNSVRAASTYDSDTWLCLGDEVLLFRLTHNGEAPVNATRNLPTIFHRTGVRAPVPLPSIEGPCQRTLDGLDLGSISAQATVEGTALGHNWCSFDPEEKRLAAQDGAMQMMTKLRQLKAGGPLVAWLDRDTWAAGESNWTGRSPGRLEGGVALSEVRAANPLLGNVSLLLWHADFQGSYWVLLFPTDLRVMWNYYVDEAVNQSPLSVCHVVKSHCKGGHRCSDQ